MIVRHRQWQRLPLAESVPSASLAQCLLAEELLAESILGELLACANNDKASNLTLSARISQKDTDSN
jgi:hypothetical protein